MKCSKLHFSSYALLKILWHKPLFHYELPSEACSSDNVQLLHNSGLFEFRSARDQPAVLATIQRNYRPPPKPIRTDPPLPCCQPVLSGTTGPSPGCPVKCSRRSSAAGPRKLARSASHVRAFGSKPSHRRTRVRVRALRDELSLERRFR